MRGLADSHAVHSQQHLHNHGPWDVPGWLCEVTLNVSNGWESHIWDLPLPACSSLADSDSHSSDRLCMFCRRLPYGACCFGLYRSSSPDQSTQVMLLGVAKLDESEGMAAHNLAPLLPAANFLWRWAAQQVGKHQQPHAAHPYCLQAEPGAFDDKQRSETEFFEYVAKSYHFFLAGDDYQSQAVDDEKAQELEERAGEVKLRNQAVQQVGADTASSVLSGDGSGRG